MTAGWNRGVIKKKNLIPPNETNESSKLIKYIQMSLTPNQITPYHM